jgi:TetR/AcrR family transcriptional regulator, transcriptional repressor for nem operon
LFQPAADAKFSFRWNYRFAPTFHKHATNESGRGNYDQEHMDSCSGTYSLALQFGIAQRFPMSDPSHPRDKDRVRQKIVRSAARLFNHHGFAAVSIDQIMAGAGLTRGGFYAYFGSKSELYAEAIALFIRRRKENRDAAASFQDDAARTLRQYLVSKPSEKADAACPLIGLTADFSQNDAAIRGAHEDLLKLIVETFEQAIASESGRNRQIALALASLCVGGLMLARMIDDPALADELRAATMAVATLLGGWE